MPKKEYRYTVTFSVRPHGDPGFQLAGVLDMLRYDGARVIKWDRQQNSFILELESPTLTLDRWGSFGLHPKEVE